MNSEIAPNTERKFVYRRVVATEKGLAEMQDGRIVVFVPRTEIQRIELRQGSPAERPVVQACFGLIIGLAGLVGGISLNENGLVTARWEAALLFFGAVGLWLVWEVVKRRYYLLVVSADDSRKLVFANPVDRTELIGFIESAAELGYQFQDCLEEQRD